MQHLTNPIRIFALLTIVTSLASIFLRAQNSPYQGPVSMVSTLCVVCVIILFIYERSTKNKN